MPKKKAREYAEFPISPREAAEKREKALATRIKKGVKKLLEAKPKKVEEVMPFPHGKHIDTAIEGALKIAQSVLSHPLGMLIVSDVLLTAYMNHFPTERDWHSWNALRGMLRLSYIPAAGAPLLAKVL